MFQEASTQTLAIAGLSGGAELGADRLLAHRYRLLDRRGGDGTSIGTVLADDLVEGGRVVLKIVPAAELAADFALQISSEAENRRRVHSHRLAPLVGFGRDGEICYFAARMPPGVPLANLLAAPRLDVAVTLQVAIGVFSALRDLHEHGLLLGCLDPSLVFVGADPSARAVTVLNMALPWSWKASAAVSAEALTAAAYISPEQSGFIESRAAFTSDLYSTGILLYRCLAGATPFRGNSVGEVLLGHVTTPPRELRSLGLPVPRVLDELILRVLRKDPRDRYQTAEAVLADLRDIAASLSRGEAEPQLVIGQSDRRATLTEPSFVSRTREINELTGEFFAAALDGRAGLFLVEGESGAGKTRLLEEFAQRAAGEGAWVLRGHASEEAVKAPFQLLDGVVAAVVSAAESDPAYGHALARSLASSREALSSALPRLAQCLGWSGDTPRMAEEFGPVQSVRALCSLLDALGSRQRPAVVILDDCQWADELMIRLIEAWHRYAHRTASKGGSHVFLVAAFRTEEVAANHPLRSIDCSKHLVLSLFQKEEIRALAESMAGPLPADVVDRVYEGSGGSPFMATAILRGLVESDVLSADGAGWRLDLRLMAEAASSRSAGAVLSRRIDLLPAETADLLGIGAVLGKEFELRTVAHLADLNSDAAMERLAEAQRRHFVWIQQDTGRCLFVHDKIRMALLSRLEVEHRRGIHRRAANYFRRVAPENVFDLAYHFDAAGESECALPFALEAAERARKQHSLEVAEQQYQIASRGLESASEAMQFSAAEGLGEVLMLRGRYDKAELCLKAAVGLASGRQQRARITGKLGELALKRGQVEDATQSFEAALRLLGFVVPRRMWAFTLWLVGEVFVQLLHSLFPRVLVHRRRRGASQATSLGLRFFSRLAHGYWFSRSKVHVLWAHLRGLNLGEIFPPSLELAQAYSEHAPAMTLLGWFQRGIRYAEKSFAIRKSLGDVWGQGQSLGYHGVVLYAASRFQECVAKCRESIRLLERTGDYWEIHIARYQLAASLYHLGDHLAAVQEARTNQRSGVELGDAMAAGISLDVWSRAAPVDLPDEIVQREVGRERNDAQAVCQVLLARAVGLLARRDTAGAIEVLQTAVETAIRSGVKNAYTLPAFTWLATARRLHAQQLLGFTPAQRKVALRRAAAAARRAVRTARICANDLPQALREYAMVSAMQGKTWRARRLFARSRIVATRQAAPHEYARTLLAEGHVGLECGWPDAERQIAAARAKLREKMLDVHAWEDRFVTEGGQETLSLVDRFDSVLESGRRIAGALEEQTICTELRSAALRLLRGESCLLLQVDQDDDGKPQISSVSDGCPAGFDAAVVRTCLQTGRSIAFVEESWDDSPGALLPFVARSALCAPLHVRRQAVACLYVTHSRVRNLFGRVEERVADFVAAIAGAALENANGFRQLQLANETLERRVLERTAAVEARAEELAASNRKLAQTANELRATEERLREASSQAEAASRAKSQFLATMSHEIRTPMNGVIGMVELLRRSRMDPVQQGQLNIVKQSADALLRLLNDILDFSKIEAGKLELECHPFDLHDVVCDATQVFSLAAASKGIELICRVASEVPRQVKGDSGRLRQVLVNLVGNAVKFTQHGTVFVEAYIEPQDDGAGKLHCVVHDSGLGIPLEKQKQIFEAFSQADRQTTRRFGGTGLGLAISSQLLRMMGGEIWVDSQLGQGSHFHFRLPLDPVDGATVSPPAWFGSEPPRVLLVVAQETSRCVYAEALANAGLPVKAVAGVKLAFRALKRAARRGRPVRVLFLDDDLPQRAGLRLARRIRRDPELADCSLAALVSADKANKTRCWRKMHVADFVAKPARTSQLLEVVRTVASGAGLDTVRIATNQEEAAGRPLHILLAEDVPVNQIVAEGLLELLGHKVTIANNGTEAVEAVKSQAFDIVFMDIEMPDMDGLQATSLIRHYEKNAGTRVPIVAMSAHAMMGFQERCQQAGMDGYVSKPIVPEEIKRILGSVPQACCSPASA